MEIMSISMMKLSLAIADWCNLFLNMHIRKVPESHNTDNKLGTSRKGLSSHLALGLLWLGWSFLEIAGLRWWGNLASLSLSLLWEGLVGLLLGRFLWLGMMSEMIDVIGRTADNDKLDIISNNQEPKMQGCRVPWSGPGSTRRGMRTDLIKNQTLCLIVF